MYNIRVLLSLYLRFKKNINCIHRSIFNVQVDLVFVVNSVHVTPVAVNILMCISNLKEAFKPFVVQ